MFDSKTELSCLFCGQAHSACLLLVEARGALICEDCVDRFASILAGERAKLDEIRRMGT